MSAENTGRLEVYAGGVKSGKTEQLEILVRKVLYSKEALQLFIPSQIAEWNVRCQSLDTNVSATPVETTEQIGTLIDPDTRYIFVDSAHLLRGFARFANQLANNGYVVIVGALDMDNSKSAYDETSQLLVFADNAYKLHAICSDCGEPASFSQLLPDGTYDPKCRIDHKI